MNLEPVLDYKRVMEKADGSIVKLNNQFKRSVIKSMMIATGLLTILMELVRFVFKKLK